MASQTERGEMLFRVLIIIAAVILLAPLLMMVVMIPLMGLMGWWGGGAPGLGIGITPIWGIGMMLLFLLALLGLGYLIYRGVFRESLGGDDPALEELRLAYARGELSQEEFEQRQEDLRRSK